jgi:prevent-host-death family protein
MDSIAYTAARALLADTMDRVVNDHEPLIITRSNQQSVVMLSWTTTRRWRTPPTCCAARRMPSAC